MPRARQWKVEVRQGGLGEGICMPVLGGKGGEEKGDQEMADGTSKADKSIRYGWRDMFGREGRRSGFGWELVRRNGELGKEGKGQHVVYGGPLLNLTSLCRE